MVDADYCRAAVEFLREKGIEIAAGLTDEEVAATQTRHGFVFPPDLRLLLQTGLPVSKKFPNWRSESAESLQEKIDWPVEGICFDVEHNNSWAEEWWGERPAGVAEAVQTARRKIRELYPLLIPVFYNRYMPAEPPEAGNPVFSIQQSEVMLCGADLASCLENFFGVPNPGPAPAQIRSIPYWCEMVEA